MDEIQEIKVHPLDEESGRVFFGSGICNYIVDFIKLEMNPSPKKILVVTDRKVKNFKKSALFLQKLESVADTKIMLLERGNGSKSADSWNDCIDEMSIFDFSKNDIIVALGGGSVGDVAGFAASIYCHGLRYVYIPTSLLSMADPLSSGKVGVDWGFQKNLIESTWSPAATFIDLDFLRKLPEYWWRDGFGEILKCNLCSGFEQKKLDDIIRSGKNLDLASRLMVDEDLLHETLLACIKYNLSAKCKNSSLENSKSAEFGNTLLMALINFSDLDLSYGHGILLGILGELGFGVKEGLVQEEIFECVKSVAASSLGESSWKYWKKILSELNDQGKDRLADLVTIGSRRRFGTEARVVLPGRYPLEVKSQETRRFIDLALESICSS